QLLCRLVVASAPMLLLPFNESPTTAIYTLSLHDALPILGVAYWMLPRPGGIKQTSLEMTTFLLLQAGMITRVAGEPWWRATGDPFAYGLFAASGGLVFAAVLTFAYAMSKRIVTVDVIRAKARPRKGTTQRPR